MILKIRGFILKRLGIQSGRDQLGGNGGST